MLKTLSPIKAPARNLCVCVSDRVRAPPPRATTRIKWTTQGLHRRAKAPVSTRSGDRTRGRGVAKEGFVGRVPPPPPAWIKQRVGRAENCGNVVLQLRHAVGVRESEAPRVQGFPATPPSEALRCTPPQPPPELPRGRHSWDPSCWRVSQAPFNGYRARRCPPATKAVPASIGARSLGP